MAAVRFEQTAFASLVVFHSRFLSDFRAHKKQRLEVGYFFVILMLLEISGDEWKRMFVIEYRYDSENVNIE